MSTIKTIINNNVYINTRDTYYKVLVVENCITNQNGLIFNTIKNNNIKHVVLNDSFHESVLYEIIDALILVFMYNDKFDCSKLYKLNKLKSIVLPDTYQMTIDFSHFEEMEQIDIAWNNNLIFKGTDSLKYLILRKYGKEVFELVLPESIEFLELIQGKLKSLKGIEKYQNLKALVIYSQPKIEDFSEIGELRNLEFLHIYGGHLKNVSFITKLNNLKWLVFENCKEIETLKPLMQLENLLGVQLVGATKVADGDKSIRDIKNKYEYYYPYKTVGQRLYKEL